MYRHLYTQRFTDCVRQFSTDAGATAALMAVFAEHEIGPLRALNHQNELAALEPRMRPGAFRLAYNLVAFGNPEGAEPEQPAVAAEPAAEFELQDERAARQGKALEQVLSKPASRQEFAPVAAEVLAEALSKPIEDWMVFLHPDQARLTQRPCSGPARVRGAAGTGKTVVALHRARHLADTYDGAVLFTTYVRNLPTVLEHLYRRLPPTRRGRVEFANLHRWAWRFLAAHGQPPQLDPNATNAAYSEAWRRTVTPGSYLAQRGYGFGYYREELDWVIKGRALDELDGYLALARTGRGTPLNEAHRRAVWELFAAYRRGLAERGAIDFNDVLIRALRLVEAGELDAPYSAVVVDEAQDLTEVGVRLAHALAGGDKRDGLFLVGDGQQAVYPGGYSLASVGIDVVGRSAVLRTNYRNTRQVLDLADRIAAGHAFDDLDEQPASGDRDVVCTRDGEAPVLVGCRDGDSHDTELVAAIDDAATAPGVGPGDLAVLVPTNKMVAGYAKCIRELGYRTLTLDKYRGEAGDEVKVGTYQRAKGLEFKWVFLPHLDADTLGERKRFNEDDDAYAERLALLRRRLFVSATRARDRLWVGWVGAPSRFIARYTSGGV